MDDPSTKLKIMAEELEIYLQGMNRAAPHVAVYDELVARVTVQRTVWHDLMCFLQDCKKVVEAIHEEITPPDPAQHYAGENIINLNHERSKRLNKTNERMKPL
jgi:hypothetical protein